MRREGKREKSRAMSKRKESSRTGTYREAKNR